MSREVFKLAVEYYLDTVAAIKLDQLDRNALGVWNLRDLLGHTARAFTNVERYATVGFTAGPPVGSDDDIAARGIEAGRQLGNEPLAAVREIAKRVVSFVDALPDNHVLDTSAGQMSLIEFLPSRVQELTTHSIDIARAIGLDAAPPEEYLRVMLYWLADQAIVRKQSVDMVLVLTGRETLPDGFNLVAPLT